MTATPMTPITDTEQDGTDAQAREALRLEKDRQSWAMLCHLSSFASTIVPFGNIFGPLTVYLIKRHEYEIVEDQGRESVNFQISMTIYTVVLAVAALFTAIFGGLFTVATEGNPAILLLAVAFILLLIIFALLNLVFTIIASIRAYRGERFRYPLTIRFLS